MAERGIYGEGQSISSSGTFLISGVVKFGVGYLTLEKLNQNIDLKINTHKNT